MNRRERALVAAALVLGGLAGMAWGCVRLVEAADAATAEARDLVECERLARRIETARGETRLVAGNAGARDPVAAELSRRIEAAATGAELPEGCVGQNTPGPARRLGDGPFVERATVVQLRGVSLRQLFAFLHALAQDDARVGLKSIRLSTPAGAVSADLWDAEGTLTQTAYSPSVSAGLGAAADAESNEQRLRLATLPTAVKGAQ